MLMMTPTGLSASICPCVTASTHTTRNSGCAVMALYHCDRGSCDGYATISSQTSAVIPCMLEVPLRWLRPMLPPTSFRLQVVGPLTPSRFTYDNILHCLQHCCMDQGHPHHFTLEGCSHALPSARCLIHHYYTTTHPHPFPPTTTQLLLSFSSFMVPMHIQPPSGPAADFRARLRQPKPHRITAEREISRF